MPLQRLGFIDLPAHVGSGGFDDAAVHEPTGRVYVADTANDAVDVIDIEAGKHVGSIGGLTAVAGALVTTSPELGLHLESRREHRSSWYRRATPSAFSAGSRSRAEARTARTST